MLIPKTMDRSGVAGVAKTSGDTRQMRAAVAVLAKTPGLTPAKTRLAAGIGVPLAGAFYSLCLKSVEAVLLQVKNISLQTVTPYWAVAEKQGLNEDIWKRLPVLWTGDGAFGKRLSTVYSTLLTQYDTVILIGTDSPQLEAEELSTVVKMIRDNPGRLVIGPSFDGGFYLFGGSMPIPESVWTEVEYSRSTTLGDFIAELEKMGAEYTLLPKKSDVDTRNDLGQLYKALMDNQRKLSVQQELEDWLRPFYHHSKIAIR